MVMTRYWTIIVAVLAGALIAPAVPALAQEREALSPSRLTWLFSGPLGKYD
jgi:hypothetical protein